MQSGSSRSLLRFELLGLVLGLALCAAIYYPGLRGGFIFDDWANIVQNERLHVDEISIDGLRTAAFSADSGMLKRPISMLSFWANYYATGLDPFYFKLVNLLIHLLNGIGLYWLSRLLLEGLDTRGSVEIPAGAREGIALATALIWLVHPLNVTSVLYVVQRMTSLCATFTILGLLCYVLGRRRLARGLPGFPLILLGLVGFGSLAVLSKENGALLPLYMAAIEIAVFRFSGLAPSASRKLKAFFLVTVAAPLLAAVVFLALDPAWLTQQYRIRDFTLVERLLTEARALWLYLMWLVAPTRASLGLFHDDIPTSHALLDPPSTALAIVGLVAACAAAIRFRNRAPLFTFAVLWYLAGHVLESSVVALELVHEHRNYLPIFGPLLAVAYALWCASARLPAKAQLALASVFTVAFAAVTFGRSLDWSQLETLQIAMARDHPRSPRANYEAGTALGGLALRRPELAPTLYDETKAYLDRAASLDDHAVSPLFGLILLDAANHRPLDEVSINRLATRLAEMPLNGTVIEPFRSFVDWTTKHVVVVPDHTVVTLFESALGNPTADHRTRAILLSFLSTYEYNVAENAQEAVSLAVAAVEEDPAQPAHHMSLAYLARDLGNFELAARELEALNRNDPLGRYASQARELAGSLPKADSGSQGSRSRDLALR